MRKMFGRIPPVGNPITIKTSDEIPVFPGSLKTYFLNSGTAALAAGLQIAKQHCNAKNPEVIIPAYCCPDLLSAILYNNMKPVLVDFIPDKPYMDLNGIEEALTENTVAVIAVNFLGIPERLKEIKVLLADRPTLLIEDSAQWFPESDEAFGQHQGDLVVYSFGKGKPVSVLSGGALLLRTDDLRDYIPLISATPKSLGHWAIVANYNVYNKAISPYFYWALELLPFLNLGKTEYHSLEATAQFEPIAKQFLVANISAYRQRGQHNQLKIHDLLSTLQIDKLDLPLSCNTYADQRLLRYSLLLDKGQNKTAILNFSRQRGLGMSEFYGQALPYIAGIPASTFNSRKFQNTEDFAARLITIPTHCNVLDRHLHSIIGLLK